MGKFGRRNVLSDDIFAYNLGLIGESGIGKTTTAKEICEKIVGADGYIDLNMGKEDGFDAISDIEYENIQDWKKFDAVTTDIIKTKTTDYPNLKVILIDTYDQLCDIVEPEALRRWNIDQPADKKAKTLNGAWGGFGKGEDKVTEIILDRLWELKNVGVKFFIIGHVKKRDIEDIATGQTYSTLTTNMQQRYFSAIKNKLHVLGVASVDREIVKEKTGKKNIVTKKENEIGVVKAETRKITFRDDNYSIDSKSRFADIVGSIPMNSDAFIKAIQDAIKAEKNKSKNPDAMKPVKRIEKAVIPETTGDDIDDIDNIQINDTAKTEIDVVDVGALVTDIRGKYKACQDKELRAEIKGILADNGGRLSESIPVDVLNDILNKLS